MVRFDIPCAYPEFIETSTDAKAYADVIEQYMHYNHGYINLIDMTRDEMENMSENDIVSMFDNKGWSNYLVGNVSAARAYHPRESCVVANVFRPEIILRSPISSRKSYYIKIATYPVISSMDDIAKMQSSSSMIKNAMALLYKRDDLPNEISPIYWYGFGWRYKRTNG